MLSLDAHFDSASLNAAASRIEGDRVRLVGRDDFVPGKWKWINFKLHGAQDKSPTFTIADNFAEGPHHLDTHAMVFSEDAEHWQYFARHQRQGGEYRFAHDRPFTADTVQIAYAIPYPLERLRTWLDTLQVDKRALAPDLWQLRLGAPKARGWLSPGSPPGSPPDNPDKTIVLFAGVHPNESVANYTLEGAVDHLLAHPPAGATVHVFPMVNPTGRRAGLSRGSAEHPDRDANRVWRRELWADMPEIHPVINNLPGGRWDVFVDFHAWTDARPHFAFMDRRRGYPTHPIWRALLQREPDLAQEHCGTENPSTETMAIEQHDAGFAMTFETAHIPGENVQHYRRLGRHIAQAIVRGLAP